MSATASALLAPSAPWNVESGFRAVIYCFAMADNGRVAIVSDLHSNIHSDPNANSRASECTFDL